MAVTTGRFVNNYALTKSTTMQCGGFELFCYGDNWYLKG